MEYKIISNNEVLQAIIDGYNVLYVSTLDNSNNMFALQNLNELRVSKIKEIIKFSDDDDKTLFIRAKKKRKEDKNEK